MSESFTQVCVKMSHTTSDKKGDWEFVTDNMEDVWLYEDAASMQMGKGIFALEGITDSEENMRDMKGAILQGLWMRNGLALSITMLKIRSVMQAKGQNQMVLPFRDP